LAWVSIAEAARRLDCSDDTIRRRIRTEELQGRQIKEPGGFRWEVWIDDAQGQDSETKESDENRLLRELVDTLRAQVQAQQEQLAAKDQQLAAREREVRELHVLLQQAQAALPAPRNNRRWWQLWRRE
jgi:hypothetical protein